MVHFILMGFEPDVSLKRIEICLNPDTYYIYCD